MKHRLWSSTILCCTWLVGCSGPAGESKATDDALDRSKTLAQVSAADYEKVCDAVNLAQGGYAKQQTCSDGSSQTTDTSQASCVELLTELAAICSGSSAQSASCACTVTVGQAVDCASAQGPDLCHVVSECEPVRRCVH
jgi:hypothetical protein